ncbi:hypothetical protein GCM10014719_54430 [Planomonospora parontospora subsp. antibiotica]|nr:hypothetical protein GCM10014719_54430 [Planomonospora parontospora subsp. antibiotica]GII16189.1 hypothetical protein Ppa05_29150 [Planomonospora parontospora subsp. antibiotica]
MSPPPVIRPEIHDHYKTHDMNAIRMSMPPGWGVHIRRLRAIHYTVPGSRRWSPKASESPWQHSGSAVHHGAVRGKPTRGMPLTGGGSTDASEHGIRSGSAGVDEPAIRSGTTVRDGPGSEDGAPDEE